MSACQWARYTQTRSGRVYAQCQPEVWEDPLAFDLISAWRAADAREDTDLLDLDQGESPCLPTRHLPIHVLVNRCLDSIDRRYVDAIRSRHLDAVDPRCVEELVDGRYLDAVYEQYVDADGVDPRRVDPVNPRIDDVDPRRVDPVNPRIDDVSPQRVDPVNPRVNAVSP
uniref:Uncharacterized protein n=1 Tax=Psilocybe cubensis TaxID=181762 RepID=A0A8H7XMW0_PSICU